jgi:HK97 family phage major capsid protein/HK97 family phage prohead protease
MAESDPVLHRAWAVLEIKAADPGRRTLTGIASTPSLDRQGHIFETAGATFKNPIPLLLHHDIERPIGFATLDKRADGIVFEATLATAAEPGPLSARLAETEQLLQSGLLRGVSIGFRILSDGIEFLKAGVTRIVKSEICELSLVTIPANRDATILTVKALDLGTGVVPDPPADAGLPVVRAMKDAPAMTIPEQITQWSNTRAPKAARMTDLMKMAADTGVTLDPKQVEEYEGLKVEVKSIDAHLGRLREMDTLNAAAAQPITSTIAPVAAPVPVIQVKSQLPLGTSFVRMACAKAVCNGNVFEAAEYAKRWMDSTPEVVLALKAAVAAGNTTDATWAGPLVNQNIANDFIELLRPATILGKIPGLRVVPFNTKVPAQSAGGTYGWVGESKPKPVTKLAFTSTSLGISKAAGIIVLTEELVRLSNPSAEALVRDDMIKGIAQFLDLQFIDPAVAAVAGVNPASVTNGAPTAAATTSPLADILGLIQHFATNNIAVDGVTFIMSAANALSLSFRTNLDGSPMFPGIGINGGNYRGLTFITSQAAGANVIALQPALILYADEGGVTIDVSREASLQMDSAPMSPADATTVYVSLWQNNAVGLRAERFINWNKANANAVKYLTAAAYPAPSSAAATGTTLKEK